jgi:hypothetical protein
MTTGIDGERGVKLLDGKTYTFASLTLGQMKLTRALLPKMEAGGDGAEDAATAFLGMSLKRRHPDLTPEALAELVDMRALPSLVSVVMELSGLAGDASTPGEASAG